MATQKKVVTMKQDIPSQLETLRADVATLAETLKSQAKTTISEKASTTKNMASKQKDLAKSQYNELTDKVEVSVKENPLATIAVAVGAGFVLSALLRR